MMRESSSKKRRISYPDPDPKQFDDGEKELLYSVAGYLKRRGFLKVYEDLVFQADIKKEDLNNTIPDLEELYLKYSSKEPKDEPSEPADDEKERGSSGMAEGVDASLSKDILQLLGGGYDYAMVEHEDEDPWTDKSFSWETKNRKLIPKHRRQREDDCWAYALSRGQNAAVLESGSERRLLTHSMLKDGVSRRYQNDRRGLSNLLHAKEFMIDGGYVKEFIVHSRPRKEDEEDADFESLIEKLLMNYFPMTISFEQPPSYSLRYQGIGVYFPTEVEIRIGECELFPMHTVLLTAFGKKLHNGDMVEYWEYLDSQGRNWGDYGFGCLARRLRMIRKIVQLKV